MKKFFKAAKALRVLVALAVFCAVSAKFFDVYAALPQDFAEIPLGAQFSPSLIKMLSLGAVGAGAAFVSFTILALVFGRAYCSFFCLFGILMDILRRAALLPASIFPKSRLGKFCKSRFGSLKFKKARNGIRAAFLAIAALSIGLGYGSLFGFIDPYSLYGKIMGSAAHPAACVATNALSDALYSREIFAVRPVNGDPRVPLAAFGLALFLLAAAGAAAALRGRIFCNTICPVGAFLGFFAKFSLFKISLDKNKCVSCGMCERACKAQCIDSKNKEADFSRCVLCFDCANNCPKNAVRFSLNPSARKIFNLEKKSAPAARRQNGAELSAKAKLGRRDFSKAALGFCVMPLGGSARKGLGKGRGECACEATPFGILGDRPDKRLAMPPGAGTMENFLENCTACQRCTAACKAHILKPSLGELGLAGLMQPYMDFSGGYCIHNCNECSAACPTGAIKFIGAEKKLRVKIGTAIFKKELCVVNTDGTDCAACAEHCPVSAIEMLPFGEEEESLYIPHVHSEVCIGCGACEFICPVRPHKAIVVKGLRKQKISKAFDERMRIFKPETRGKKSTQDKGAGGAKNSQETKSPGGDFPF